MTRDRETASGCNGKGVPREPDVRASSGRRGLTLIEILVVITLIAVLIGILMPAISMVRNQAKVTYARQTLQELQTAFDVYRAEHPRKRYPEERADKGIHEDLLDDLDERRLWSRGDRLIKDELLVDPWMQPYRYSLSRPNPSQNADELHDWNWDPEEGRVARWGARRGAGGGTVDGALAFPYLWSIGRRGKDNDASTWIYPEDGS